MALIVTRREVRDSFRDWRIIIPTIVLTIFFPALMNFTAQRLLAFVSNYGAEIIGNQLIPFLLLVVGFFPISFSLIIALETFVGEKERKSLEPLLATPLTNTQLYLGKMMASLVPPLFASYLGIAVYLLGLWLLVDWTPGWLLFIQTILLTTIQGVIMVAGAVVVSSQTTSVRASNLLASFIIVPMALLIQGEAAAMFWGNHGGLWWLILALFITAVTLIRMGVRIFNREELMGNEIDQIRLGYIWQHFWGRFSGKVLTENGRYPTITQWYKQTFRLLSALRYPIPLLTPVIIGSGALGYWLAQTHPFSPDLQAMLTGDKMLENLASLQVYNNVLPTFIVFQNVRALMIQAILGVFTLGVLGLLIFMLPWAVIGFVAGQFAVAGQDPWLFLLGTIVPHAIIEVPALLIASAAAWRWHVVAISPPPDQTLSEAFLTTAADFLRLLVGVVTPLLIMAAMVEAWITPQVLAYVYGL
ncbi:MAG: hypothetical protein Kow0080_15550 [Candidatus Promineifilaceae bacterium]